LLFSGGSVTQDGVAGYRTPAGGGWRRFAESDEPSQERKRTNITYLSVIFNFTYDLISDKVLEKRFRARTGN
jgi:hypothetical protein